MEIKYQKAFSYITEDKPKFPPSDKLPNKTVKKEEKKSDSSFSGIPDFSSLAQNGIPLSPTPATEETKPARKRKSSASLDGVVTAKGDKEPNPDEIPYSEKYEETTNVLKGTVLQIEAGLNEMERDLAGIRASRTLKRKYDYIAQIQGTMGQYLNAKITAIREINNTISKCNDLELKRRKELNLAANEQNSDKSIMDMYNAFISMPTGNQGVNPLGPTVDQFTLTGGSVGIPVVTGTGVVDEEAGMRDFINNMSPAQRLTMYEKDPNVQQVVVYDNATGARYFEVMNLATGEVIPNVDKRDMMFMDDTVLDLQAGVATNINLNESYPIVEIGQRMADAY